MKILTSCNDFLTKNRKNILYVIGFIFVFFILSDFSFAENTNVSDTNPDNKNFGISLLNGILKNLAALLGLLTFLVGLFLEPEWTSGSIVGLGGSGGALKQMWIMMSNVVYFIFAMIFIWIAFMNIIGKDADTYGLKSAMPRFIVGVLIVPFTWFLVQFILSISSILTVGVLSLPYDTFKDTYMKDEDLKKVTFCKDRIIYTGTQPKDKKIMECKDKGSTITLKDIVNPEKSESLFGIMSIYTYGIMSVDGNGKIYSENLVVDGLGNLFDLGIKVLFDLVFVIVYLILMIALALALFVRGVYLWFYAMLSPVFGLLYFFKKQNDGVGDAGKKFNLKEFIALAFVPVYVSAALAFGLLFIFAAGNSWGKQSIISEDGKRIERGLIGYTLKGPATNDGDAKSSIKKLFTGFQGTFGTLILQVFGLAILWIAVMAALKQSSITQNVIDPFDKFGESIGQLAMKAPTYAPIIPTGSGMMSAASLGSAGQSFQSTIAGEYSTKGSRFGQEIAKGMFGIGDDMLNKLDELIKKPYITQPDIQKGMQEGLQAINADRFKNDPNVKNKLADLFQKLGANTGLITQVKGAKDVNELSQILQKSGDADWKTQDAKNAAKIFLNNKTPAEIEALIGGSGSPGPTPTPPTPGNGPQTININTGTAQAPVNTSVNINLVNGKVQLDAGKKIEDTFSALRQNVTEVDFKQALKDKGVTEDEINKIINDLGVNFFKPNP